jgi:hypothetical protein
MAIDMSQDSVEETGPTNEQVIRISALANEQMLLEDQIAAAERRVAELTKRLREVSDIKLPEAMKECGMLSFTLKSGMEIQVSKGVAASIAEERREPGLQWFREQGFDDLIKSSVNAYFGKGEDETAQQLCSWLTSHNIGYSEQATIHSATLKKFIAEQLRKGRPFSEDERKLLSIYEYERAKIVRPDYPIEKPDSLG